MAGGFDHVVGAADEPEVTVLVLLREIAGQIPAAGKTLAIAFLFVQISAKHRWPAGTQSQLADLFRFSVE